MASRHPRDWTPSSGSPVVAQGAFGPPGPVLYNVSFFGWNKTFEVTEPLNLVDIAIGRDGSAWLLGGDQILYRKTFFGDPQPVLNLPEYQAGDPDPDDLEDLPAESNPYGLAVLPNGDALVADAAGNDVMRVTKKRPRIDVRSVRAGVRLDRPHPRVPRAGHSVGGGAHQHLDRP